MKVHVLISGEVQGVFFRAHTKEKADELGLQGWVRNREDGKVEAVFEGPKDKVEEMVRWCWQGSSGSRVTSVKPVKPVPARHGPARDPRLNAGIKPKEKSAGFEIHY